MSVESDRGYAETIVHVGNRIVAKDCFIGLSTSFGRLLIRGGDYGFRPLISREMGCEWAVVKVLREASWNSATDRPPTKVTASLECLDTDGRSYICKTLGGDRVRLHPSDIKETVDVLVKGQKLEMVLCSKRGPVAKNALQVCCIASVICPGGLAATHIKLEASPIEIESLGQSRCPERCTTSMLLKGLVQAAGGINGIRKELGSQLAEEIKLLTLPKREIKLAPE